MKKLLLSLPVFIAIGLSGCGSDDTTLNQLATAAAQNNETVIPLARVVFDPAGGKLSVPNDLLFNGTSDGTLEMPDEVAARVAFGQSDYSEPGQALGVLDGWSTQNPFLLDIDFPIGYSLDANSAGLPGAVRLFEVKMGGEPGCETVPLGVACQPVGELTFGVDFVTRAKGNSVAVAPLKPLKAATTYIMAMTDLLKDNVGRSIGGSSTYELVKQDINTHPLVTPSQLALQGLVNSYEAVIGAMGVDSESVIYTAAMTTQSVGQVLASVKTMMAANLALNPAATPVVAVEDTGVSVAAALVASGVLEADNPALAGFTAAKLYQGQITLPYYLAMPTAANPMAPVNTSWKAACDSGVKIMAYAQAMGEAYPYDPATTVPLSANDGMCMAFSGGRLRDLTNPETGVGIDAERHLTKYNSIPAMSGMNTLDVQMTTPDLTVVNTIRSQMGMEAMVMPEAGWPVVMLGHGVGSAKEAMLGITASLALSGFATVAIDLPLHASRGFDIDGDGSDDINASSVSPIHFLNLGSLTVARDNLRQAIADMLGLRLGLNFVQGAGIDGHRVYALGLSLGAIEMVNFLALTNMAGLDDRLGAPGLDGMFKVGASVLASPGGGLASLLTESAVFGPLVKAGILSAAGTALADEFNAFLAAGVAECVAYLPNQEAYGGCGIEVFLATLAQSGQVDKLAGFEGLMAQFVFATQTVIDVADPNNYGAQLAATGTPILLTEVIGDGGSQLTDQVVPNQTLNSPMGGTDPLIRALGLADKIYGATSAGGYDENGQRIPLIGVVRFTKGHHSSIINPAANSASPDPTIAARVTAEMQNQAAVYLASDGWILEVNDPQLLN